MIHGSRDLQSALNARGWTPPPLALDGEWGPATDKAVSGLLSEAGIAWEEWRSNRRALAAKQDTAAGAPASQIGRFGE
ncbi:hypothetical protein XFLAVUS301_32520 [Xanthobacter flavus]|uniref:Peptidoglycan binding-like domain-containing protein n=1 Tax=Xanthobacter flavus TaxID=281 RepID=A0A9W6CJJ1_XANFL|nr:hypothetical protein XFLAVUS301_32520 [Xanthobacter flavus]